MIFNYHEQEEPSFTRSFILQMMSSMRISYPEVDFMEETDDGKAVDVEIKINGHDIDPTVFFERCVDSIEYNVKLEVAEKINEITDPERIDLVFEVARNHLRSQFNDIFKIKDGDSRDFWDGL